jgi:broad specificity phosphatase PhoE
MEHLRLYLLRHGETVDSHRHLFNGHRDVGLTDLGKSQLQDAAKTLTGIPFDALYSSDLSRARYGGERIAEITGLPLVELPEFREMSFGACEGISFPELEERYPDLAYGIMHPYTGKVVFPEGESDRDFFARISKATDELVKKHPKGRVILVSHAGVGRAVLAKYLELTTSSMWAIHQDFAALHVLDIFPDGTYVIRALNAYLGQDGYSKGSPGYQGLLGERGWY